MSQMRSCKAILILFLTTWTPVAAAGKSDALQSAGKWVWGALASYSASKAIDWALGLDLERQLEERIPYLISRVAESTGAERERLERELDLHQEQLDALQILLEKARGREDERFELQQEQIASLKSKQQRLNRQVDALADSVERLEERVETLDERVELLESSYQSECLDLRDAPRVGADGYRVQDALDSVFSEQKSAADFSLSLRMHLNVCTPEMTDRGLLIRVSLITRDLDRDLALYVTFKHLEAGDLDSVYMNQLTRLEYSLNRPSYRLDGQVREFFLPYAEIPFTGYSDRIAMAVVLTHDGGPLYNSGDQVLHCVFAQRTNCRWR